MFLDANILIELILDRPHSRSVRSLLANHEGELFISSLTSHLVVHFGQAIVELPVLRAFLRDYTILSVDKADIEWAFANVRNKDFEDAVQLGCAIRNGCNDFVTLDKALVKAYRGLPTIRVQKL